MDPNQPSQNSQSSQLFTNWDWQTLGDMALVWGVKILGLFLVFLVAHYVILAALNQLEKRMNVVVLKKSDLPGETEKRMKTLFGVFRKAAMLLLWVVAILTTLNTLGVEIGPVIAAAGVFGLAISFGAQSLVKDVISGVFILFENQIRVGDVAIINGTGGLVEEINLRTVVLRDAEGMVHIFPNGNITTLSNRTKDWSAAVLDIGVGYGEDVDRVIDVLHQEAAALRQDPDVGPKIIADAEIWGVETFGDSAVTIKMRIKTKPIEQWAVARAYRRRVKLAFDREGIEIPFPQRTFHLGEAGEALKTLAQAAVAKNGGASTPEAATSAQQAPVGRVSSTSVAKQGREEG